MKIDEVDLKIINFLEENGRMTNKEMAAKLSLSEGTIRNRINKLVSNNFLKVKGLTNPSARTDKQIVYILVKVPLHKGWDQTGRRISEIPEVKSVSLLTGRFDLLVEVFIEPSRLVDFINEKLGSIKSIDSTESLISVKHYNKWI
ncbi:MAG: hypothetical protein DRP87_12675 [Spirochaetes bacterium]|nr:MAG: hypothetical protein DRP87_12675 [Spirochaetota bacterium]